MVQLDLFQGRPSGIRLNSQTLIATLNPTAWGLQVAIAGLDIPPFRQRIRITFSSETDHFCTIFVNFSAKILNKSL